MCKPSYKWLRGCQINIFKSPYSFNSISPSFLFLIEVTNGSWPQNLKASWWLKAGNLTHLWLLLPQHCQSACALWNSEDERLASSLRNLPTASISRTYSCRAKHRPCLMEPALEKKAEKEEGFLAFLKCWNKENCFFSYCSGIIQRLNHALFRYNGWKHIAQTRRQSWSCGLNKSPCEHTWASSQQPSSGVGSSIALFYGLTACLD